MTRRQAKKILRRIRETSPTTKIYRCPQVVKANEVLWQPYAKNYLRTEYMKMTPGYRWGRWDPAIPKDPNDIPF